MFIGWSVRPVKIGKVEDMTIWMRQQFDSKCEVRKGQNENVIDGYFDQFPEKKTFNFNEGISEFSPKQRRDWKYNHWQDEDELDPIWDNVSC